MYPKECGYILLRDCQASSLSSQFSIRVQNEECKDDANMQYCKKQNLHVTYRGKVIDFKRTISGSSVQIEVYYDSQKITEYLEESVLRVDFVGINNVILSTNDFDLILTGQDLYLMEKTLKPNKNGLSKTCGLCGTYNYKSTDDFTGPNNALYSSAGSFLQAWLDTKEKPGCDGILGDEEPTVLIDYCTIYEQNSAESLARASKIKSETGPFKDCLVSSESFYKLAMKAGCRHRPSLCDIAAGYAKACGDAGYKIGDWRWEISACSKRK